MECREAQKLLREGKRDEAHLAACPACAQLAADQAALARRLALPESGLDLGVLEADVARLLEGEKGAVAMARAWPRAMRFAFLAAAGVLVVGFLFVFLRRMDFAVYPHLRYWLIAGSFAVVGLTALWHSLRPLHRPPLPGGVVQALVAVGVILPIVVALLPAVPSLPKGLAEPTMHKHVGWAFYCWATGSATGLVLLAPLLLFARDGLGTLERTLFAGIAAGMVGLAAVFMECSNNHPMHLLLGHAMIPVLFLGVTAALRRARH